MYRRFSKAFLANTKEISKNFEHPMEMIKAMRQMMKYTTSRIHMEYVTDLFKQLKTMNLGTNEVMTIAKRLFPNGRENEKIKVVRCIMNEKLSGSMNDLIKKKSEETKYWRIIKPMFQRERIYVEFEDEWKSERTRKRTSYKEKRKSKII